MNIYLDLNRASLSGFPYNYYQMTEAKMRWSHDKVALYANVAEVLNSLDCFPALAYWK